MVEYNIINVINLEDRTLRLQQFHQESLTQGFGYRVWPGIIVPYDNKRAINLAHRQIVQYAKDNNLLYVIIAEDDCRFFAPGAWKFFLDNMPSDYDTYHGMFYVGVVQNNRIKSVFSGMTLYAINFRFYDFFLSLPESIHIDRELGKHSEQFKFMVCPEFVCEQDGSKSDNTKMTCDYRPYIDRHRSAGIKIFGDVKVS